MVKHPKLLVAYHATRALPDQKAQSYKEYSVTTQLILNTAAQMGVDINPIPDGEIIELKYKGKTRFFYYQITAQTNSMLSQQIINNKSVAKYFLKKNNINTQNSFIINASDPQTVIESVFRALNKPLVVKPINESHGNGVFLQINHLPNFKKIVTQLFKDYKKLIVEEMFEGVEYRLTSGKDKLFAVTRKIPANVVGDHLHTILQLIEEKNIGRGEDTYTGHLVKIKVDNETINLVEAQGLSVNQVPALGQFVQLKSVSNISQGGDSLDETAAAHPSFATMATQAIRAIPGLDFAGIDLFCEDITRPLTDQKWTVLEINDSPGFCMAEMCAVGPGQEVSKAFIELLFA